MKVIKTVLAVIAMTTAMTASANEWRNALNLVKEAQSAYKEYAQPHTQNQTNTQEAASPNNKACLENVRMGMPSQETATNKFVCREGYALMFNTQYKVPMWVAEQLNASEIFGKGERASQFSPDPMINARYQATRRDYSRSGWDQGHMAPAGDFSQNQTLMNESFYYTNVVPQNPDHNRVFWSSLEKKVRGWTSSRKQLYVITGPVFTQNPVRILGNGVAIPDSIFKIVYDPRTNNALAVLSPNVPLTERDIPKYLVTVREVEKATGLNFLSALPQNVQDAVENHRSGMWTR